MYTCTACGSNIPDGRRFCPQCGAMFDQKTQRPDENEGAPWVFAAPERAVQSTPIQSGNTGRVYQSSPAYNYQNPEKSPERPLGTGEFFVALLLMSLPGIGLLMQIIWACGASGNKNRTHLARACLIGTVILLIAVFIALYWFSVNIWPDISPLLDSFLNGSLG